RALRTLDAFAEISGGEFFPVHGELAGGSRGLRLGARHKNNKYQREKIRQMTSKAGQHDGIHLWRRILARSRAIKTYHYCVCDGALASLRILCMKKGQPMAAVPTFSYGTSISCSLPSLSRCRTMTLPLGSRNTQTSRSLKCASLIASSSVMGRIATDSSERTR